MYNDINIEENGKDYQRVLKGDAPTTVNKTAYSTVITSMVVGGGGKGGAEERERYM